MTQAESDELRATGRAILLLIEEVEALHVDLWNAKETLVEPEADGEVELPPELHKSLASRLRLSRGRAGRES